MNELTETQKHKFCMDTLALKRDLEERWIEICARLSRIKAERLYEAGWTSWEEYGMEFKMSGSQVSRMVRIHDVLVTRYRLSPQKLAKAGGWTVVAELLPAINENTPREEVLRLLELAEEQPRKDLALSVKDVVRGKSCPHKDTFTVTFVQCRDCGERWKEDEENGREH